MDLVSIVVPCYNEENTIALLLDAIYHSTYPRNKMEVILSDGQSTDRTREVIQHYSEDHVDLKISLVENTKKTIPAALNAALSAAVGEYIVRLDAHSVPAPDYIERCITLLKKGSGDNVGGVWVIQPGGIGWISRSIAAAASHPFGVGDARYRYTKMAGEVDTVPFGSFKRKLLKKVGMFDESLLANEDYEFNTRIRQSGGKVWLDPGIRTVYFARSTLGALAKQYWRYGFWKYNMLKRYPETLRWRQALPPAFILGLLSGFILALFIPQVFTIVAGILIFYVTILSIAGVTSAIKQNDPRMVIGVPLAIGVMHFAWGAGFLFSAINAVK